MAVIRINKTNDYTIMSNYHLKEPNMSLKAKGLLSLMLSLPDNWDYSIKGLVSICKENISSIKSILNELKKFGYLKITKILPNETKSGRFEYIYDIYEMPKQEYKKQEVENQPLEILPLENQPLNNTNIYNIYNKLNNKELNNKENTKRKSFEEEFEDLWENYPNKKGKANALKSYINARTKGIDENLILQGILNYKKYCESKNIQQEYIKYGSTWFKQECWNDEYDLSSNDLTTDKIIDSIYEEMEKNNEKY